MEHDPGKYRTVFNLPLELPCLIIFWPDIAPPGELQFNDMNGSAEFIFSP